MKYFNLTILCVLLLSCGSIRAQELIIISPHWEGMRYEFETGFAKWREKKGLAAVKVIWRDIGGTSEIVRFVQSEFQGQQELRQSNQAGIGIDLVFGGGIDPFVTFKKQNLLAKLDLSEELLVSLAAEVSGSRLFDQDKFWFAPTVSAFGIFCNQKVLTTLGLKNPLGWEDLLKPELKTWVTSADPRRSGSAHMFYEIILQAYGWEKGWEILFGLAKNYRTFLSNSSQVLLDVVNGEVACGFAIDSQANSQIIRHDVGEFKFIVPQDKSLFNGDGIAVLKGAPNFKAASEFVEFSLSVDAQHLLYLPKGSATGPVKYALNRLPVLPQLYKAGAIQGVSPFSSLESEKTFTFSSELSSSRWEALNDLLGIFLIEAKDAGRIEVDKCQNIIAPEAQVISLINAGSWTDQVKRNQVISNWRKSAASCSEKSIIEPISLPFFGVIILSFFVFLKGKFKKN